MSFAERLFDLIWPEDAVHLLPKCAMPMPENTTRTYPRTVKEAFREWPENCIGVNDPIPTKPTLLEKLRRLMAWRRP